MVNTVSLFVFLVAWLWQHRGAQGEWDSQSSHLELAGDVLLMAFPCKVPSHPEGPAFPSEKNLPRARKEQQELFPPNCLQDTFGTMSTPRPSTTHTQMSPVKKIKDI